MVRVAGCIQSEADYRKARNLGRGGTAGTGVGVANEFVLIDTKMASAGRITGRWRRDRRDRYNRGSRARL